MKNLTENAKQKMYDSQRRIHEATLDRIQVYVKKGEREVIKDFARRKGLSLNSFIVDCIHKAMKEEEDEAN